MIAITTPAPLGQTWTERTERGTYTWTDRNRDVWWRSATARPGDPPVRLGRASTINDAERIKRRHQRKQREQEQP